MEVFRMREPMCACTSMSMEIGMGMRHAGCCLLRITYYTCTMPTDVQQLAMIMPKLHLLTT